MDKHSMSFGKKERVLNYACQTYQLSRPNKVGAVMALIRDCQPASFEEWESWYFGNAYTAGKNPTKNYYRKFERIGRTAICQNNGGCHTGMGIGFQRID